MLKDKKCLLKILSFMTVLSLCTSHITYASEGETDVTSEQKGSKVITVEYGDYIEKGTLKGVTRSILRTQTFRINERSTFLEYVAQNGSYVSKGDKLIAYEPLYIDQIALEEALMRLEQARESYSEGITQRKDNIEKLKESISELDQSSVDGQIASINLQKAELELVQYQYDMKQNISSLEENVEELREKTETQYIEAPYDGLFISNDRWIKPGDVVDNRWEMGYIYDTKSAIYSAKVTNLNKLWYGMNLELTDASGRSGNKGTLTGRIVGEDSLYNSRVVTELLYIKLDDPEKATTVEKVDLVTDVVKVENVIVIPLTAVKYKDDVAYVYVLGEDGSTYKQYLSGRKSGSSMWVYSGLTVGQKILSE